MTVQLTDLEGVTVAALPTEVDAANAARLREELASAVPHGSRDIVLDLRETRYLDSAGIDMLFRLGQRLTERRAVLRVVLPATSPLRRLAGIVGLERGMTLHPTIAEAVEAARETEAPRQATPDAADERRSRRTHPASG